MPILLGIQTYHNLLPLCPSVQNNSNCTMETKTKMQREMTRKGKERKLRGRREAGGNEQREPTDRRSVEKAGKGDRKKRGSPVAH